MSWTVSTDENPGTSDRVMFDGIPTVRRVVPTSGEVAVNPSPFGGANALAIDHVVVNTDNLERTSHAVSEALGTELRRVRDAGRGVTQGFHVLDNTVVEIVSGPHITEPGATLWGFVVVVDHLDAVVEHLGNRATPVKPAVQPGRFISSLRSDAGLGVPIALMSPRV